jgi:hypothetical protein
MSETAGTRQLVLVVGAGRSGTSLVAGLFGQLGFHVPQPEVKANATNPRGFGEPRWVVDFHAALMKRAAVGLFDARPQAWADATRVAERTGCTAELGEWLGRELAAQPRLVVKDPRTSWFLPSWTAAAGRLGVPVHCVSPLRHPTEVLTSVRTTAKNHQTEATRAAWWVNMTLATERMTRSLPRAYLAYDDLLEDWREQLSGVERRTGLALLRGVDPAVLAAVDAFVDPSLRRSPKGWEAVDVPAAVRDLAEEVWEAIGRLTVVDDEHGHARLDELRSRYDVLYAEAEAVAESTAQARAARAVRAARRADRAEGAPAKDGARRRLPWRSKAGR